MIAKRLPYEIERLTLKRSKGWRLPKSARKIDRSTRWGNPFKPYKRCGIEARFLGVRGTMTTDVNAGDLVFFDVGGLESSLALFRAYAVERSRIDPQWLAPLYGWDLACWCGAGKACHGDVLIELMYGRRAEIIRPLPWLDGGGSCL